MILQSRKALGTGMFIWICAAMMIVAGCAAAPHHPVQHGYAPDWYMVTASANYRPVNVPGTQRRVAQTDAEDDARRQIMAYVGDLRVGGKTVNQTIAQNTRIRSKVQDIVRTAELVDWRVDPACAAVQVWMRVDLNRIRQLVALCP